MKLKRWIYSDWIPTEAIEKLSDKEIIKEFSMSDDKPWLSWQEFGSHKSVVSWVILETGHAVGFNENVSRGWSYPIIKLTPDQLEKCLAHNKTYEDYWNTEA